MLKRFLALIAIGALIAGSFVVTTSHAAKRSSASTSTMSLVLKQVGLSGAAGTATLTYDATSDMTTVKLMVKNLVAMSSHPAHIHTGKCGQNTPVVAPLTNVVAASDGIGTSTTIIKGSWAHKVDHLNVHYGPGLTLTQYTVISCVNLK
jgi:hypothetical protein